MLAIRLAFKNLLGAGLRTWLNVSVLSLAFVVMVFYNGMLDGWNRQAINDTIAWEVGNGQLWHPAYDVYDPLSFQDAHAEMNGEVKTLVDKGVLVPVLVVQASVYPKGHMLNLVLKGIDPQQQVLKLPTHHLNSSIEETHVIIGKRMAKAAGLQKGDRVLVRWRDVNGTFDASEVVIADVFQADVPTVDLGSFWLPLDQLQQMTGLQNEATLLVASKDYQGGDISQWQFKDTGYLLREFEALMKQKKAGSSIIYGLLMAIALLAIFDTQVLSIFRRQCEIGTYIAMGMTRRQVVWIFTVEGSAHSLLALLLAAVYGIPLLVWMHYHGIPMPEMVDETGIAIAQRIIPVYSFGMVAASIALVVLSATIVSYFPARRISKMNPTDALKGKLQ